MPNGDKRDFGLPSIDFISRTSPCSPWSSSSSPAQIQSVWLPPPILLAIRLTSNAPVGFLRRISSYADDVLPPAFLHESVRDRNKNVQSIAKNDNLTPVGSPIAGDQGRRPYHLLEGFDVRLPP